MDTRDRPHTPEIPTVPLATAAPEHIRRVRGVVALCVITAFFLEVAARFLDETTGMAPLVTESVSFVALVLLCGTAVYLIFMLQRQTLLRRMISVGAGILVLTQGLSLLREASFWRDSQNLLWEWSQHAEGVLFLTGVVMLLATFYLALIEMVLVKSFLQREQLKLCEDIAVRSRAEVELRESRDKLRHLTAHVERIREAERARIARELHDELGQDLTSLRFDVEKLRNLRQQSCDDGESAPKVIDSMTRQIAAMVKTTRRIVTELHPAILDDLGLHAALEWLVSDFQSRTQIPCSFDLQDDELPLSKDSTTALFRIAQECLTNVARHADANRVNLHCSVVDDRVVLGVDDNGRGFVDGALADGKLGFGILGMRERVSLLGGEFSITSTSGAGTRVRIAIPRAESNGQAGLNCSLAEKE
jgi:signal transduction histidine kinase